MGELVKLAIQVSLTLHFNLYIMKKITWDNIQNLWDQYDIWYERHCSGAGVKKHPEPNLNTNKVSKATYHLLNMYLNKGEFVCDKDSTIAYAKLTGTEWKSIYQFRHYSTQEGYDVSTNDKCGFKLNSIYPLKGWHSHRDEDEELSEAEWIVLKEEFNNRCATCGSKEGEKPYKRKYTVKKTKLQKGHCDPNKSLTRSNCIPQCAYCNRIYKDKFIFDQEGNVNRLNKDRK